MGDEAVRESGKLGCYIYSVIGGTTGPHTELAKRLKEIKNTYVPKLDPDGWVFHATKITNGYYREKHKAFQHLSRNDVQKMLSDIAASLKSVQDHSWNMCIVAPYFRPPDKRGRVNLSKDVRASAHAFLTTAAIYRATRQGLRPKFIFDATAPIKNTPHIEGWSYGDFEDRKHYLGYELISHGNAIAPPEFVAPGSRPSLEIADVHAYCVGRKMHGLFQGVVPDFDITEFGNFYYLVLKGAAHADFHVGSDIPKNMFDGFLNR